MKKIALVTGALGGIGYATVKALHAAGYRVAGMDIAPADAAVEKLVPRGEGVCYFQGNLADGADRERVLAGVLEKFGGIDTLVNVAGVAPKVRRDLLEMTEESYDFVMGINTKGTLFLTQAVAREMIRERGEKQEGVCGYIVNSSSCSAYTSSPSRGEYCISKAGVSMITTLFADRLAGEGIVCNEVCPGVIMTGMTEVVKAKYDALIAQGLIPIARWGQPEDVAKAVLALCDGSLGYTTGQSVAVDGGMHIRHL